MTALTAQLVLASGSRAGMVAAIHPGYYLIGRCKECQIRPKSRSVSRRHCLLHWDGRSFLVLDLGSTSGTRVGGEKITPRNWVAIPIGSELRCGKIAFRVDSSGGNDRFPPSDESDLGLTADRSNLPDLEHMASVATEEVDADWMASTSVDHLDDDTGDSISDAFGSASPDSNAPTPPTTGSMLTGAAWQEADVADFLAAHDAYDREVRYDSIRTKETRRSVSESRVNGQPIRNAPRTDEEKPVAPSPDAADTSDKTPFVSNAQEGSAPPSKTAHLKKPKKKSSMRVGVANAVAIDWSRLGLLITGLVALLAVGFVSFQVYSFSTAKPTPIVTGID
ncbi:MAG: FHA domain-containing protein [Planctomycetota bacterium]